MKKRKINKAQITVFIIISIFIIILFLFFLFYKSNIIKSNKQTISPEIKDIYDYISNCVHETGKTAVYFIGQTGGYFNSPDFSTDYGIAYYYSDGKSYIPSKEKIESELSSYMNFMLQFCIRNFKDFPDYVINSENITTKTKIENEKVIFNVDYPLIIKKDKKTYRLREFNEIVNVRLDKIYDLASRINKEQLINGEDICLSCMYDWAEELDLYIEMNDYGNKTGIIIFTIRDEKSQLFNSDYRFYFANKYKIY
ncbi:MAG: hypothetical protein QXW97_04010 [Candidatus Pacearchaeota archaeon]